MARRWSVRAAIWFALGVLVGCADRVDDGSEDGESMSESCAMCDAGSACVIASYDRGPIVDCVPIPEACSGTPSCACMGELACGEPGVCADEGTEGADLSCYCPAC